jgi:hypothetical protein
VLTLDHVNFLYGSEAVSAYQSTVSITNSVFSHLGGDGIDVSQPDGIPVVTGNTVTSTAGDAIVISSANVDMAKLNGNNGSGDGLNGIELAGDTVAVSSALPWTGTLSPVVTGSLDVASGSTLSMGPSALLKFAQGATLYVEGTLSANGSAVHHAVLTSLRDDTVGGDTNGDGDGTAPAADDWVGIEVVSPGDGSPDPSVTLNEADVLYATTGLGVDTPALVQGDHATFNHENTAVVVNGDPVSFTNSVISNSQTGITVASGDSATFQGEIINTDLGAYAPQGAVLNVQGTDWGSSDGPAPWGNGTLIQGAGVSAFPWAGVTPPPPPPPPPAPSAQPCADVLFIGVDGSSEHPGTDTVLGYEAPKSKEMQNLYASVVSSLQDHPRTLRAISLDYPADSVSELAAGWLGWLAYYQSYYDGLWGGDGYPGLIGTIETEYEHCPSEKLVLAGYSQGAWIVHDAVAQLAEFDPDAINIKRIGRVVLLADPERLPDNVVSAGSADSDATGILTHLGGYAAVSSGPTPESLLGVTYSVCNSQDLICAPSTIQVTIANSAVSTFSGAVENLSATSLLALADSVQLHTGDEVHTSRSPAPPDEYACDWSQSPGCGSILTDQGEAIAHRILLFAKPTTTHFMFSGSAAQAFDFELTADVENLSATWRTSSGSSLPTGVSLSSDGHLAGTLAHGTYNFTVEVAGGFDDYTPAQVTLDIA